MCCTPCLRSSFTCIDLDISLVAIGGYTGGSSSSSEFFLGFNVLSSYALLDSSSLYSFFIHADCCGVFSVSSLSAKSTNCQ
jgi:hypothetical protein